MWQVSLLFHIHVPKLVKSLPYYFLKSVKGTPFRQSLPYREYYPAPNPSLYLNNTLSSSSFIPSSFLNSSLCCSIISSSRLLCCMDKAAISSSMCCLCVSSSLRKSRAVVVALRFAFSKSLLVSAIWIREVQLVTVSYNFLHSVAINI